jgi:quercetin 2,3-dioxygenase
MTNSTEISFATIQKILPVLSTVEGEGFKVNRPFPKRGLLQIDPFLLVDEFGPQYFQPGEAKGTPPHPHKGFEILSYLLAGGFAHQDSLGHTATIADGDMQWMTAGRGIVHKEQPIESIKKNGGFMHGFQIWINLPAAKKNIEPSYQEIRSDKIPTFNGDGFSVKVLVGEAFGTVSPILTHTPVQYHHYTVKPDTTIEIAVSTEHNTFIYPLSGSFKLGESEWITRGMMPVIDKDGERIHLKSSPEGAAFIVLSGKPLNEPMVRYGPFVMNTNDELEQAFMDYQRGEMGSLH